MPAGRARGSGAVATIPAVELTRAELIPYKIGYRLGGQYAPATDDVDAQVACMTVLMTPKELRDLAPLDYATSNCWIMIGIMVYHLDASITAVRRS